MTEAPLAVRLPFSDEFEPTTTLPKLRLVGDTAKLPARRSGSGECDIERRVRCVRRHGQVSARRTGTGRRKGGGKRHALIGRQSQRASSVR